MVFCHLVAHGVWRFPPEKLSKSYNCFCSKILHHMHVLEERKSQKMMGKMMRNSRWCFYSRCFMKKVAGCINTVDRGPGSVALYDKKVQGEKAKTSTGQSNKLKACWELQGLTVSGNSLSLRGFNPLLSANEKIIEKYLDANICSLVYLMLC